MFGSGFMVIAGIIIYLSSSLVISLFTNDQEVINSGALYLQVAALIGPIYPVFLLLQLCFRR